MLDSFSSTDEEKPRDSRNVVLLKDDESSMDGSRKEQGKLNRKNIYTQNKVKTAEILRTFYEQGGLGKLNPHWLY